jgi:hypothetical protein
VSIDERIEFLMQSIESHDRQIGELVERMDRTTANIDALRARDEALGAKVDRMADITQLNFDRLTTAMLALNEHSVDHRRRIENLER